LRRKNGEQVAYPDTLWAPTANTTMVNGVAVLVGRRAGSEAEAAMLGPTRFSMPDTQKVVGFELQARN